MSKTFKTVLITVIITATAIIGGKMLWDAAMNFSLAGGCGEEILKEVKSPDGRRLAIAYIKNCGATTSYSTGVRVRMIGENYYDKVGAEVFAGYRSRYVDVSWLNNNKIRVSHSVEGENLLMQKIRSGTLDVEFVYEPEKETYR